MKPSDCPRCEEDFMARPMLQAEMQHLALTLGASTAEAELNERMADTHAEHEEPLGEETTQWVKRDSYSGRFAANKTTGGSFKDVRREK